MSGPKIGDTIPAAKLLDADGATIDLAAMAGAPLVVYFYPKADTPGCTVEAQDFTRLAPEFAHLNAQVLAVSRDAPAKLCLAHQVGQGFAGRPTFDPFGKLRIGRRNDWCFRARQQVSVRAAGGVLQQQAGIEPVDFLPCCGQRRKQGHFQFCSASSAF